MAPPNYTIQVQILRGQENWLPFMRQFTASADAEGILPLIRGTDLTLEKILEAPIAPVYDGTAYILPPDSYEEKTTTNPMLIAKATELDLDIDDLGSRPKKHDLITRLRAGPLADLRQAEIHAKSDYRDDLDIYKMLNKDFERQQERIRTAKRMFARYVDNSIYPQIASMEPRAAWDYLCTNYAMQPTLARSRLFQTLRESALNSFESVQAYVTHISNIALDLKEVGGSIDDEQVKDVLLAGLPPKYNRIVEGIHFDTGVGTIITLQQLIARLLTFETITDGRKNNRDSRDSKDGKKPTTTSPRNSFRSNKATSSDNNNPTCPKCKKRHAGGEDECWFLHPEKNPWKNGQNPKPDTSGRDTNKGSPFKKFAAVTTFDRAIFLELLQVARNPSSPRITTPQINDPPSEDDHEEISLPVMEGTAIRSPTPSLFDHPITNNEPITPPRPNDTQAEVYNHLHNLTTGLCTPDVRHTPAISLNSPIAFTTTTPVPWKNTICLQYNTIEGVEHLEDQYGKGYYWQSFTQPSNTTPNEHETLIVHHPRRMKNVIHTLFSKTVLNIKPLLEQDSLLYLDNNGNNIRRIFDPIRGTTASSTSPTLPLPKTSKPNPSQISMSLRTLHDKDGNMEGGLRGLGSGTQEHCHTTTLIQKYEQPYPLSCNTEHTFQNLHLTSAFLATVSPNTAKHAWLSDSGANGHLVNDKKWFAVDAFFDIDMTIGTAGSESLHIAGGGKVNILSKNSDGQISEITLTDVAYAPKARCNLLSLHNFCYKGHLDGNFSADSMHFLDQDGDEVAFAI